jgi:DNA-binding MarR family transcriptional regulator
MPTNKQLKLLRYLIGYCQRHEGDRPTLQQQADAIEAYDHKSVIRMLHKLEEAGYIELYPGTSRFKCATQKVVMELGLSVSDQYVLRDINSENLSISDTRIFKLVGGGTSHTHYVSSEFPHKGVDLGATGTTHSGLEELGDQS